MTLAEAERLLLSLELFGMRFGLDRMRRLLTALGSPQERFGAVHVVGTNGKSSTVRMTAAILRRHGLHVGAYLSPHLVSFTERVRVDDADVSGSDFAAAVQRAARAAEMVNRTAAEDDHVTQFELLTAAAFDHFANGPHPPVDVAVVEAGLGGRFDATNVLPSKVAVLTNVGLEHTRWLGPTVTDIATEKLAVVEPASTLVVGAGLHPDAARLAETVAAERGARLVVAPTDPGVELQMVARGGFQRRNFALAAEAARAYLEPPGTLDGAAVRAAAASTLVPGRFDVVAQLGEGAEVVLDGAHNPGGMEALAEALPEFAAGRRLVACLSVLDDKDATEMLRSLLPLCDALVATRAQSPRALPPATLASLCHQLGFTGTVEIVGEPRAALERARGLAGTDGVALATGSIYLIADLLRPVGAARSTL
jgi:dihydrofolate synthase/folylpolyglutamate synthase